MIKAIVDTGELSDPQAARYLTDVIIKRRDKVVAHWIGQTNPLDRFAVSRTSRGAELTFDNAAIRLGVAQSGPSYKVGWLAFDNTAIMQRAVGEESDVRNPRVHIPDAAWGPRDDANSRYAIASIKTVDANHPNWMSPVLVTVREREGTIDVVGVERPTQSK
jgi:hypothetical protein